jgi:hypothetical protein
MATNLYFAQGTRSEQVLYEDLIIESLKMYGQDVYYIPREIVKRDRIFEDDAVSRFDNAYRIETYIENTEGFDGEGDLFTKFGVEIRDAATFIMARRRWESVVATNESTVDKPFYRPREGDLLFLALSGSMFEITKVEDESPFYQLKDLPVFKMRAELFEYNDEDFDTGVAGIDLVETVHAYQTKLFIPTSEESRATVTATLDGTSIDSVSVDYGGAFYTDAPRVFFPAPDSGAVVSITLITAGVGYDGSVTTPRTTTGGSGTGLTVTTTGAGGLVGAAISNPGSGYVAGDTVIIDGNSVGVADATLTLDSVASSTLDIASGTATVVGGSVTAITVDSAGRGYASAPTVTIAKPPLTFDDNEEVQQNNTTYTMVGEVVSHDDSDGILYVAHGGATDGEYHTWTTTNPVVGQTNNVSVTPTSVGEDLQDGAQNEYFETEGTEFIDFTESNPFGDP